MLRGQEFLAELSDVESVPDFNKDSCLGGWVRNSGAGKIRCVLPNVSEPVVGHIGTTDQ